jgi:hypothetical protein
MEHKGFQLTRCFSMYSYVFVVTPTNTMWSSSLRVRTDCDILISKKKIWVSTYPFVAFASKVGSTGLALTVRTTLLAGMVKGVEIIVVNVVAVGLAMNSMSEC